MINHEVKSEDVKQAITSRLIELFPGVNVYKEANSTVRYPHFFVSQINLSDEEERKNYHILTYSMDIRYRVASDPSTDLKLQQKLDSMSYSLLKGFNIIPLNDDNLIRVSEKNTEKVDGVLHFFCTLKLVVKNVSDETKDKLNKLEVIINGM